MADYKAVDTSVKVMLGKEGTCHMMCFFYMDPNTPVRKHFCGYFGKFLTPGPSRNAYRCPDCLAKFGAF